MTTQPGITRETRVGVFGFIIKNGKREDFESWSLENIDPDYTARHFERIGQTVPEGEPNITNVVVQERFATQWESVDTAEYVKQAKPVTERDNS